MKKTVLLSLILAAAIFCVSGCKSSELKKNDPVTLTMWHVYGEQSDSPMNRLVDEFNRTVGSERGIIINVTAMSNASHIGEKLLDSQSKKPGADDMPDLFFAHLSNAVDLGVENLINWNDLFSEKELSKYVPEFLDAGTYNGNLCVFPVAKSTHMLFIAGEQFDRFSQKSGVTYESLSDWGGFFDAAEKYHTLTGKAFCSIDYPLSCIELDAMENGAKNIHTDDGRYDFDNEIFKNSFMKFANALVKGQIILSDLYSNTQVMTGEVMSGIGSSAAILYYNDTVTYEDGTSEPMNLKILPVPREKDKAPYIAQAGVGLCAYKTTPKKAEAAAVFAEWLTQSQRNLDFAAETGYMPVVNDAFEKISDYDFKSDEYKQLYAAIGKSKKDSTAVSEPLTKGYYSRVSAFYDIIRKKQKQLADRYALGTSAETLSTELWEALKNIN